MRIVCHSLLLLLVALSQRPVCAESLTQEYQSLRETIGRREFGEAINRCKELIERYPHHMPLYETLGEVHQYASRLPEAISYLEGRIVDGTGISLVYFGLGNIYYLMQEDRAAIQRFNRAIELGLDHPDCYKLLEYAYERLEGVDNTIKAFTILSHRYPENANYWYALALAYWGKGDYATCRIHLEQAISRRSQEPRFHQALAALNLSSRGRRDDIEAVHIQLAEAEIRNDNLAAHHLRAVLVEELVGRREIARAKKLCQASLAAAGRLGGFRWTAWASLKMADINFFSGQLDSAMFYAREAVSAGTLSGTQAATRDAMERVTETCLETSDYLSALTSIDERLSLRQIRSSDRDRAKIALDLSRTALELGHPENGLDLGTAALSLAQSAKSDSLLLCQIHTSIGLAFLETGRLEEAERNLLLAERYNPFDRFHVQVASVTQGNLGLLSMGRGRLVEAYVSFGNQKRLALMSGFKREEGTAYANLGKWSELMGRIDSAQALYQAGYQIGLEIQNAGLIAQCAKGLAHMCQQSGEVVNAVHWHLENVRIADSMAILGEKARFYPDHAALIGLLVESNRFAEAFLVAERSKAYAHRSSIITALSEQRAFLAVRGSATEDPTVGSRLVDNHGFGKGPAAFQELGSQGGRQKGWLSTVQDSGIGRSASMIAPLTYSLSRKGSHQFLEDLRILLPDSTILIEFARSEDKWGMFVLSKDSLAFIETHLTTTEAESLIENCSKIFVGELADQKVWNSALAQFNRKALSALYSATLSVVRERKSSGRRFIIVPDGPFRKVPFECLITEGNLPSGDPDFSDRRFVIEDCIVTYLPTAASIGLRETARRDSPEKFLLAIGGVTAQISGSELDPLVGRALNRLGADNAASLPGSLDEVKILSRMVRLRTTLVSKKEATRKRLLDEGPQYRVIHIAAHVRRDVLSPLRSGFAVSSAPDSPAEEITLADLLEMTARSDLVVLNGCSSNSPSKDASPGGVGTALLAAGVPSVIATLWDIDDRTAAEFMIGFYGYLLEGIPTDEALRQAKLDLMQSGKMDPYYWAGFVLVGVPVDLPRQSAGLETWASVGILSAGAGAGVLFMLIILTRSPTCSSLLRLRWPDQSIG